ncbi:hypothetical protein SAMN06269185_2846 [Natronoarchaeum philippinense]|uniref:Halobacterial output domain-containing protein n=1 Tax=Natronoarchaeum philippinense TaxID=558529 RepID=A0A285P5K8_NATPI|nr:HalOD1 output domain-containing protein [Natronoarchaeum philippinense]SNZ17004.1 hypothetical protein SAMN06269185_2846 [Natronoarchaeum philippinense]
MKDTDYHAGRGGPSSDEHRFEWDEDAPPSVAVIEAVASISDRDPIELDPLHGYVDPDALDAIFERDDANPVIGRVSFRFEEHLVVVNSAGEILVYPP